MMVEMLLAAVLMTGNIPVIAQDASASRVLDSTVGDATESVYVEIPPKQTRHISESVYFPGLGPETPGRAWHYDLLPVRAKK